MRLRYVCFSHHDMSLVFIFHKNSHALFQHYVIFQELQLWLKQTIKVNLGAQCLKFLVWMCVTSKFTLLKTFTSIPITFLGQISFIKFL